MDAPPLAGLRVLDAGDFLAAPYCATLLGDAGADVIKVEGLRGDTSRSVGELVAEPDVSAIFVSGNRGKRSVALDVGSDEGRALLGRLADASDVVLHNRTAAQARTLGLDHATLAARNPRVVVGSVTAFGDDGPYAGRGAIDPIAQAMSGMMSVTGPIAGPPMRAGVTVVDFGAGLALAAGVLSALWARERTGAGRAVTTSLLDIGLLYSSSLFPLPEPPPRLGNRSHPLLADQFATSDGFVLLAVWDERRWGVLCELLGVTGLDDLASNAARLADYDRVRAALDPAIARWRAPELVTALTERGILCAQTYDVAQVVADPHVRATGALYAEDRLGTPFRMVAPPLLDAGVRRRGERPPPRLGEHTAEVLAEVLGLGGDAVAALTERGVVRPAG